MSRNTKVIYKKTTIKQIVTILEPKKPREEAYRFSNGRTFYEPKR